MNIDMLISAFDLTVDLTGRMVTVSHTSGARVEIMLKEGDRTVDAVCRATVELVNHIMKQNEKEIHTGKDMADNSRRIM